MQEQATKYFEFKVIKTLIMQYWREEELKVGLRPRLGAAAVGLQVAMRKIFFETHKIFFEMCKQI